jgi:hypothetical protein
MAIDSAVPFEEDNKDPRIWFHVHIYHECMFSILKRINDMLFKNSHICCLCSCFCCTDDVSWDATNELVVGWHVTGPKLKD